MRKIVAIAGPGALGAGFATQLIGRGVEVVTLGREGPRAWTFEMSGFGLRKVGYVSKPSSATIEDIDTVLVCVRANSLRRCCADLGRWLKPDVPVIILSNGYFASELADWGSERPDIFWRPGLTSVAVSQIGEASYEWRNLLPAVSWGPLGAGSPVMPTATEQFLLENLQGASWDPEVAPAVRRKWICNTSLNSLCGVYRLPRNGLALQHSEVLRHLFDEAWQLALEVDGPTTLSKPESWSLLLHLIAQTATNENSMARDVRQFRRTESDFLAGRAVGRYDFATLKLYHAVLAGL